LKVWAFMATSFTVRYELYACGKKFPHLIVTEPIFKQSRETSPAAASKGFGQALALMARRAQTLLVVAVVQTTFGQWLDVVTLRGQGDTAQALALDTQRVAPEQLSAHGLQAPAGDSFGWDGLFGPLYLRMARAAAGAIAHQDTATRMDTRFRRCFGHGLPLLGRDPQCPLGGLAGLQPIRLKAGQHVHGGDAMLIQGPPPCK
jgi:hypothetical protein